MTNLQLYHERLNILLLTRASELEADIEDIKDQLSDENNPKHSNQAWRKSAKAAKKIKSVQIAKVRSALKRQKKRIHDVVMVSRSMEAGKSKTETHNIPKDKILIRKVHLVAMESKAKEAGILRAKLKDALGFNAYVDFCKNVLEPEQDSHRDIRYKELGINQLTNTDKE